MNIFKFSLSFPKRLLVKLKIVPSKKPSKSDNKRDEIKINTNFFMIFIKII